MSREEDSIVRCTLCENCGHELTTRKRHFTHKGDLRNGRLYSEAEASSLAAAVKDAGIDLLQYDTHIARLQETLKNLEFQRNDLQLYRDQNQALTSPIRGLPVEILSEIFLLVSSSQYSLRITQNSVHTPVLDLSQVCTFWREVIIQSGASASPWCNLFVDLSNQANGTAELIETYAKHSVDAPWTLYIVFSQCQIGRGRHTEHHLQDTSLEIVPETDSTHLRHGEKALGALIAESSRWRDVTIKCSWAMFEELSDVFREAIDEFPILETLNLHWGRPGAAGAQTSLGAVVLQWFGEGSPRLRSLTLSEFKPWFNFPYEQLTSFGEVVGWTHEEISHLLRLCPQLQDISIVLPPRNNPNQTAEVNVCECPSLTSVNVFSESYHGFSGDFGLVNSLILENLTILKLGDTKIKAPRSGPMWTTGSQGWEEAIAALVRRSSCPLQQLSFLSGSFRSETALLALCQLVPTLTHLSLFAVAKPGTLTDTFFRALTISHGGGDVVLLPRLTEFTLRFVIFGHDVGQLFPSLDAIVSMAESRRVPGSLHSLQKLRIKITSYVRSKDWETEIDSVALRIHELQRTSMDISFVVQGIYHDRFEREVGLRK